MKNNLRMRFLPLVLALPMLAPAATKPVQLAELADLSLEQLAGITVSSVSRREERLLDAPASVFVVTAEDIRRSGATSLYEALRLAPNLQVVRGDTSQYIASARGGLAGTANKMLVLIDGRTVYSPLFSGVFSDAQFVFVEDIERIEVISGPGSTLWGTNAVNGVISVTTKSAAKTLGTLGWLGAGNDERGAALRHGAAGATSDYRVYARYFERDAHRLGSGASARDDTDRWVVGFRSDSNSARVATTIDAEAYGANVNNLGGERPIGGGHLRGRWQGGDPAASNYMAQVYYDRTEREHVGSFGEKRDTFEAEAAHAFRPLANHHLVWGGGYRSSTDRTDTTPTLGFMPASRTLGLASLYAQDEWQVSERLSTTIGVRAERNSYTGLEWLPNLRLTHAISREQVVWAALTRAVRSPSRIDRDLVVPGNPPFLVVPGDFQSEVADVAEIGYRARLTRQLSVSLTAFHHDFRRIRTVEAAGGGLSFANGGEGRLTGVEGWGEFSPSRDWRLMWGFAWMNERFRIREGHVDLGGSMLGNDPKRTAHLRSLWNVSRSVELDLAARYMGPLPNPAVPAYTVLDARLGWRVSPELELSLAVANALDREHREFGAPNVGAVFGRSTFLKVTWSP